MRRVFAILVMLLAVSCSGGNAPTDMSGFEVVGIEGATVEGDEHPEQVVLRAKVRNCNGRFSVRELQLRVGIGARRSVALTLAEPVIVKRGESVVSVPVKITVAHNSRSATLREMFRQRKFSLIEFDFRVKLRRGIASRTMSYSNEDLEQTTVWQVMEAVADYIIENVNEE
ncbi:MAG: hypothetical protein E7138_09425 [Rikenellaceae bacterium]|nr:hypothetical protein [Rikenellaceae bacterium]